MKTAILPLFLLLSVLTWGQAPEKPASAKADSIAHKYIITDGHVDLPYRLKVLGFRLQKELLDVSDRTEGGNFDYYRAKEGGLDAPFMSIYVPADLQSQRMSSKYMADSLIALVEKITEMHPGKFAIATSPQEVEQQFQKGLISLPMGMENGSPIEDDIRNVKYFKDRGISYITLTHSKVNQICDSSYDPERKWNGLSPFGVEVVKEMNKHGIMIDISHVSDSTFYQVMGLSKVPVIASHSSVRYFTPGFERNMSDDMIKLLAENGGVIQINFGSTFIDARSQKDFSSMRDSIGNYMKAHELKMSDQQAQDHWAQMLKDNPPYSSVQVVADHIEHVVKLVGIDHVGFGSDFDGVGDSLPEGLKDVSEYPNLIDELLKRGFSEEDIAKICYQNLFRVWNAVLDHADAS